MKFRSANLRRAVIGMLLGIPGLILLGCFAILCVRTHSVAPWPYIVHEDGQRTLFGTILYFDHALRELPLDILLAVAVGGSVFYAFPPRARVQPFRDRPNALLIGAACVVALTIGAIFVGTAMTGGRSLIVDNLLQNHTRSGAPLLWGAHWRYHLLERSSLILISIGTAGLLRCCGEPDPGQHGGAGLVVALASLAMFLAATVVFMKGPAFLAQSFADPQYLGHQAREFLTHASVTLPLAWGTCLAAALRAESALSAPALHLNRLRSAGVWIAMGAMGVIMAGYIGAAALAADAVAYAQVRDTITLIVPHYFEHSFTYVLTAAVALLTYELSAKWMAKPVTRAETAAQ